MSADTPLSQKLQDLDRQITAKIETLFQGLHSQLGERIRAAGDDVVKWIDENRPDIPESLLADSDLPTWVADQMPAPAEPAAAVGDYRSLLDAVARIDAETGQAEILGGLLEESLRFASRSAFFLIRQGQVRGWAGQGFGEADDNIPQLEEDASKDPWSALQERSSSLICTDEQLAGMAIRLETSPGERAVLLPFAIRGQIAGALYADQVADGNPLQSAALQLLVHAAALALETVAVSPGLSPCLKLHEEEGSSTSLFAAAGSLAAAGLAAASTLVSGQEEASVEPEVEAAPEIVAETAEEMTEPGIEEDAATDVATVEAADDEPAAEEGTDEPVVETAESPVAELTEAEPAAPVVEAFEVEEASAADAAELEAAPAEEAQATETAVIEQTPAILEASAPAAEFSVPRVESVAGEDLETTVVPAVGDDTETGLEIGLQEDIEPQSYAQVSEPTVEIDAPTLALGGAPAAPEPPVQAFEAPSFEAPVEAPAMEEPAMEAPAVEEPATAPNFDSVDVVPPSSEEIAREVEPEPELEDTNVWELEEDEEDEPTQIGTAVKLEAPEPPALEIAPSAPEESPVVPQAPPAPTFDSSMPLGQETVRLPVVTPAPATEPPAAPRIEDVVGRQPTPVPPVSFGEPVPPAPQPTFGTDPAPPAPVAPSGFNDPAPPAPATPSSFADPAPPAPAAPSSFADPVPSAPPAPTSFADPVPSAPPAPTSFVAPPAAPPAPAPTEVKPPGSSSQVVPPTDLEGPGLAFASPSSMPQDNSAGEALHEEARRLARLLVSEIKLYNEEIIEEGRRTGNIYERLKDDIDRSRQMYEERIDPRLADQEDYFYQELVQRLAGGDAALLGM